MPFNWIEPSVVGSTVTDSLLNELRSNYKTVETSISFSPAYSASIALSVDNQEISTNFSARVNEIRTAINGLEFRMSNNCNCSNCCQSCQTQTCQTCQSDCCESCQTTYCQSCQNVSCQSCQTTTCQSTICQSCQSTTCQSQTCQSVACQSCQSCQSQCNCNCNCYGDCNN